jgi:hypothetical protein
LVLGWKRRGFERRLGSRVVTYADDRGPGSISGNSLQGGSHCLPAVEWEVRSNPLPEGTDNGYHRDRYTLLS